MSAQSQFDREEDLIDQQYERGDITAEEHTKLLNELHREYREAAQEAAFEAAQRELENW